MEELEKYLFDPKNPKGFKSYKLLADIIKKRENVVFADYYFIVEIFEKEIFSEEVVDGMWDKPDDFGQLSSHQKREIYISRYSSAEFDDALLERSKAISHHSFNNHFAKFLSLTKSSGSTSSIVWRPQDNISKYYLQDVIRFQSSTTTQSTFPYRDNNSVNWTIFVGKNQVDIIRKIQPIRSSIFVTTEDAYRVLSKYPENFHPIILQQASDVHALLDLVQREVRHKEARKSVTFDNPENISYLQRVEIKNYFSLQHVKLSNLAKQREIYLVGENGDGKTLLLQAILLGLKDNRVTGVASDYIDENPHQAHLAINVKDSEKKEYQFTDGLGKQPNPYQPIFAYGINRFRNDSDQKEEEGYLTLFSHEQYLENPVKWLQNIDYREKSDEDPSISLKMAKDVLRELLDENVDITVSPNEVMFNERGTSVAFNQLSDGYKSVIIWVSDLIARLSEKQPYVQQIQDFRGIVLVDEIGVYLHPKWQYTIVQKLRRWFPQIQFIFTTHSPIVIMGASKDATFYKVYKEGGVTKVVEAVDSISNLMANGIITSPLFGLEDARSASFDESKEELDTSDDYLAGKIHQAISQRIQDRNNVTEDDIMQLIRQELDKATEAK